MTPATRAALLKAADRYENTYLAGSPGAAAGAAFRALAAEDAAPADDALDAAFREGAIAMRAQAFKWATAVRGHGDGAIVTGIPLLPLPTRPRAEAEEASRG